MVTIETAPQDFSLQRVAWQQLNRWSESCQQFLDWQDRDILGQQSPPAGKLQQHRSNLKWLLRFGRHMSMTASDPDYPDKQITSELRGRLTQLEHSWRMVHEQMPQAEAEQLLREVFPG
jgi:hypothetical protein